MDMHSKLSKVVDSLSLQNSRSSFFQQEGFDADIEGYMGPWIIVGSTHGGTWMNTWRYVMESLV